MTTFTFGDLLAPFLNRLRVYLMQCTSDRLERNASVERNKAKQSFAAAAYLAANNKPEQALSEEENARHCLQLSNDFEKEAMLVRADMWRYK